MFRKNNKKQQSNREKEKQQQKIGNTSKMKQKRQETKKNLLKFSIWSLTFLIRLFLYRTNCFHSFVRSFIYRLCVWLFQLNRFRSRNGMKKKKMLGVSHRYLGNYSIKERDSSIVWWKEFVRYVITQNFFLSHFLTWERERKVNKIFDHFSHWKFYL